MYRFEKLEVWQLAVEFSSKIYNITNVFPKIEQFCLAGQLRRASVSIASNIAEGSGRFHDKDMIRFLRISLGSIYEVVTQLYIAKNQKYIDDIKFNIIYNESITLSKMINALINSLSKK